MRSAYGHVRLMTSPTRKCDPLILLHLRISCMKCTITRILTAASAGRDDAARGVVVGIWGPFVHGRLAAGLLAQVTRVPVPGGTRLIRIGKIVI